MSWRSCGVVRDQAGKAARAASIAPFVFCTASACAYSPTTSLVFDGLMSRLTVGPLTHSPAIKLLVRAHSSHP